MPSTTKISKAKNFSFKKLSFLYLVFILFLFFSSPGQYVYQYKSMAVTQTEFNSRLTKELTSLKLKSSNELALRTATFDACNAVNKLLDKYYDFARTNNISGEKLRENNFTEQIVKSKKLGSAIDSIITSYTQSYIAATNKNPGAELIKPVDFNNKTFINSDFYFKDTPNGVIPTVFEHYKTMFLYHALLICKKDTTLPLETQILSLNETNLIEEFKKSLILGENFDIMLHTDDRTALPNVKINGNTVNIKTDNKGRKHIEYLPKKAGNYCVDIVLGSKRVLTSFSVEAPSFRTVNGATHINGEVGKTIVLPFSSYRIPANNNLTFVCNAAEIKKTRNLLNIIPYKEGRFDIEMMEGAKILDRLSVYASNPESPLVALMDITGQPVLFQNAHRLESVNTYWQVINFDMTLVQPGGEQDQFHCATRFLRNELRQAEATAPAGSTLIFNNIKLIGRDGNATAMASPLVILK